MKISSMVMLSMAFQELLANQKLTSLLKTPDHLKKGIIAQKMLNITKRDQSNGIRLTLVEGIGVRANRLQHQVHARFMHLGLTTTTDNGTDRIIGTTEKVAEDSKQIHHQI